jgi:hypothetical protein
MAMEHAVQRLTMGDVVLIDLPEEGGEVEAKVVRAIDRTERTVRVSLRVEGRRDELSGSGTSARPSPSSAGPLIDRPADRREHVERRFG